ALFDMLPTPKEYSASRMEIQEGYFFGFHDITPFSKDNKIVLANKLYFDLRMPEKGDFLGVGYFDFKDDKLTDYHLVGETDTWNFHKGCRLQWLNPGELIFNCSDPAAGKLSSKIVHIVTKNERYICRPIDSVSRDGRYATSFSYSRLEKFMPGYGYNGYNDNAELDEKAPATTGLFIVDLDKNESKLAISLEQLLMNSKTEEASESSYH